MGRDRLDSPATGENDKCETRKEKSLIVGDSLNLYFSLPFNKSKTKEEYRFLFNKHGRNANENSRIINAQQSAV